MLTRFLFLAIVITFFSFPAVSKVVPDNQLQVQLSFAPVVKIAAPSVVNIYTKRRVKEKGLVPFFADPFFNHFFDNNSGIFGHSFTRERMESSLGSGVLVQGDGLIVTSSHVIRGAEEITVSLADGREYEADVLIDEQRTDLAVLRIDTNGDSLFYLRLGDSETLEVGDLVLAIGNPFGVGQTVTSGIVSATARTTIGIADYSFFIQTDAAINPGNSGGALINLKGDLVGINTAIFSKDGGSLGIGFAIPATMVATVIEAALTDGTVNRPWLGARGQAVTADIAQTLGLDRPRGVILNSIHKGGPADQAGLEIGDVVVSIDGKEIINSGALKFRIATLKENEPVDLVYSRQGKIKKTILTPMLPPEKPAREETLLKGNHPFNGVKVVNINPAVAEERDLLPDQKDKVIVSSVNNHGYVRKFGFKPDDIIIEVNGQTIDSVKTLKNILGEKETNRWLIILKRGSEILTLRFQ